MTSGMVSSSSLPDRPNRRRGSGRIGCVACCSPGPDTISPSDFTTFTMRLAHLGVKLRFVQTLLPGHESSFTRIAPALPRTGAPNTVENTIEIVIVRQNSQFLISAGQD